MASDVIFLTNPTPATITVDGQSVLSGQTVALTLSDATTDLYAFVCKGCIAAPGALTNGTGSVTDVLDNLTQLVEKGTFKMHMMVHPILSAAGDVYGSKGLNPGAASGYIGGGEG